MTDSKQRHGCLTAWLVLLLVSNGLGIVGSLVYFLMKDFIKQAAEKAQTMPNAPAVHMMPDWFYLATVALCALSVVFTIALFRWKLWGFLGLMGMSAVGLGIGLAMGTPLWQCFVGLLWPAVLVVVLLIGGEKQGWRQLE